MQSLPFPQGYTWEIQGPGETHELIKHVNYRQKHEDQRLERSIQCTDRAQKITTIFLNKKEI
jgi:hypothetical protein